jgi:uncharacterized membrane protein YidH (DUF202 family)
VNLKPGEDMPHKPFSWLITIVGIGLTVYGTIFLMSLKETYSLDDTAGQIGLVAALVLFIVGTVVTGRLTKWWDRK